MATFSITKAECYGNNSTSGPLADQVQELARKTGDGKSGCKWGKKT